MPGAGGKSPVGQYDHGVAIEDELILSADQIRVGDDGAGLASSIATEFESNIVFVALVG